MEGLLILIETYEGRIETASQMLRLKEYGSVSQAERIKTKMNCYKTFLAELNKLKHETI